MANETSKSEQRRIASLKADEESATIGGETTPEAVTENVPETPVAPAAAVEEVVEVKKADLEMFVKRLGELEESNKRLLAVADKGRIAQIEEKERSGRKQLPTVKVTRIGGPNGKMVLAWNLKDNQSYVDGNRLVEHQTMEVFYVDGTSEVMPLVSFYRQQNKDTIGKIIRRSRDEDDGSEMLSLELPGGDILDIELKFVN